MKNNFKIWDGYDKTKRFYYDTSNSGFIYYIDDEGTIYYNSNDNSDLKVWCPSSQLTAHLHHLEQIKAR